MLSNWHDSNERLRQEARLTAYALGQLDEQERSEVEQQLAADPKARAAVKATGELAQALTESAADTRQRPASSRLRDAIEQRLEHREEKVMKRNRKDSSRNEESRTNWLPIGVVAALTIVAAPLAWIAVRRSQTPTVIASTPQQATADLSPKTNVVQSPKVKLDEQIGKSLTVGLDPSGSPTSDLDLDTQTAPASLSSLHGVQMSTPGIVIGEEEEAKLGVDLDYPNVPSNSPPPAMPPAAQVARVAAQPTVANPQYAQAPRATPMPATPVYPGAAYGVPPTSYAGGRPIAGAVPPATGYGGTPIANAMNTPHYAPPSGVRTPSYGVPIAGTPLGWARPHLTWNDISQESYANVKENDFRSPADVRHAKSTFSVDVDTASYANVRRHLINHGALPPVNAVRVEELINYFAYDYPQPKGKEPFSVNLEVADCPWKKGHQLVRVGLKGREIKAAKRPACNLVFLIDVSGSMTEELPLLKQALTLLVGELNENDRVAIVTYAGEAGVKLTATSGEKHEKIRAAIDSLNANGGTNGSAGIELAYDQAAASLLSEGANRVILATDGDLNLGVTDNQQLLELIRKKAESDIFLTVLGLGEGNLQDDKMELLADNGNGMYGYIDNLREARRLLVEQITGSLVTIAKDVKVQVEFNPTQVAQWRLIGYENRVMANRDFKNDKKDAGEIGAGHTVTALYEIVPVGADLAHDGDVETNLKYQNVVNRPRSELTEAAANKELLTLYLRYKTPTGIESREREYVLPRGKDKAIDKASNEFRFASAVAAFGMLLRGSKHRGEATWPLVRTMASTSLGKDKHGHRTEFLDLVRHAETLQTPSSYTPPTVAPNPYQPLIPQTPGGSSGYGAGR